MSVHNHNFDDHSALVVRPAVAKRDPELYLCLRPNGSVAWTDDVEAATAFESMKEAARAALRLPGGYHAFGIPRRTERALHEIH